MLRRETDTLVSNIDQKFILEVRSTMSPVKFGSSACTASKPELYTQALSEDQRLDGRRPFDIRPRKYQVKAHAAHTSLQ